MPTIECCLMAPGSIGSPEYWSHRPEANVYRRSMIPTYTGARSSSFLSVVLLPSRSFRRRPSLSCGRGRKRGETLVIVHWAVAFCPFSGPQNAGSADVYLCKRGLQGALTTGRAGGRMTAGHNPNYLLSPAVAVARAVPPAATANLFPAPTTGLPCHYRRGYQPEPSSQRRSGGPFVDGAMERQGHYLPGGGVVTRGYTVRWGVSPKRCQRAAVTPLVAVELSGAALTRVARPVSLNPCSLRPA